MSKRSTDDATSWGIIFASLILAIPITIWQGFALSHLWIWFIAPFGLPAIGIAHACGLTLIASFLRGHRPEKKSITADMLCRASFIGLCGPLFALLIGLILKGAMS